MTKDKNALDLILESLEENRQLLKSIEKLIDRFVKILEKPDKPKAWKETL